MQRLRPLAELREWLGDLRGRTITLLGVASKPGTDDVRDSPAIDLAATLESDSGMARFCDAILRRFKDAFGGVVEVSADAYKALAGADAVIVVTEWEEFRQLCWADAARAMATPYVFDGRNVLD